MFTRLVDVAFKSVTIKMCQGQTKEAQLPLGT